MTTYRIRADYKTGDSFSDQETSTVLEFKWHSKKRAKAALARIREHDRWYESVNFSMEKNVPEPRWHRGLSEFVCKVKLDNGREVQFVAPWCGEFERLHGARIIVDDDEMSFTV